MAKNPRIIDLSGQRFGSWTVGRQAGNTRGGGALWSCACECGETRTVLGTDLRHGKSSSCGCTTKDRLGDSARSHGASGTRLYETWKNMRARCRNRSREGFSNYGGRGIAVCAEWDDFATFQRWAVSSGYADDLTIERIDVNGGYEPANCTWIAAGQQSVNRRFVQRAPDGELWWHKAKANGITSAAYRQRLMARWSYDEAVNRPLYAGHEDRDRDLDGKFA